MRVFPQTASGVAQNYHYIPVVISNRTNADKQECEHSVIYMCSTTSTTAIDANGRSASVNASPQQSPVFAQDSPLCADQDLIAFDFESGIELFLFTCLLDIA